MQEKVRTDHIKKYCFLFFTCLLSIPNAYSQPVKPIGIFLSDTTKIGEPIRYSLSFRHNKEMEVLFPDSNFSFYPFELVRKQYFPTKTENNISLDSTIYVLRTFEINKKQSLTLPVFIVEDNDSTAVFAITDSVSLKEYIQNGKNIRLKEDTKYQAVPLKINYPHYAAVGLVTLFFLVIIYFLFGKGVVRRYRLYTVRKAHSAFLKNFEKFEKEYEESQQLLPVEMAMSSWKTYLSRLENIPVNTYTSTEIMALYAHEDLQTGLKILDRAIYGGLISGEPEKALAILKKFSNQRFLRRRNEIRNA